MRKRTKIVIAAGSAAVAGGVIALATTGSPTTTTNTATAGSPAATPSAAAAVATTAPAATATASPLDSVYASVCTLLGTGVSAADVTAEVSQQLTQDGNTSYTGPGIVSAAEKQDCPQYIVPANQTITYTVTGSGGVAEVTYGPSGSSTTGTSPMKVTRPLGDPSYYALTAQLQGSGTVTVTIAVDGKVVSKGTATGGYNIAQAEISKDPLTGAWQNDD
jgi:hypothetical protein